MKNFALTLSLAAVLAVLLNTPADALATPMGDLDDTTVDCIAGGSPEAIAPGGTSTGRAGSICVINPSSTCVSIGGPSVVHPGGAEIGNGCELGKSFCFDARRAWCDADTGTVTVNVVWGVQ